MIMQQRCYPDKNNMETTKWWCLAARRAWRDDGGSDIRLRSPGRWGTVYLYLYIFVACDRGNPLLGARKITRLVAALTLFLAVVPVTVNLELLR